MTTGIRFALLGPVRASFAGTALDLGPARERALLAVLLCRVNEVLGAEELLDAVWDDQPPSSGLKVIPTYIYRLRKRMAAAHAEVCIDSAPDGYLLRTEPANLDTTMFDQAASLARVKRSAGDADTARASMVEALALWRGAPFAGLPGTTLAAARRKLEEQRLCLLEERIELDLRGGRHATVVGELQALRAEHPWRERFASLLMVALYRCGRQAEALAVYEEARGALRDALGVDPGTELTATHQAVLRCEEQPAHLLTQPASTQAVLTRQAKVVTRAPRRDLPAAPPCLFGRDAEVDRLGEAAATGLGVLSIDGMPGVGKTALGLHVAHLIAGEYPDGALYLDLAADGQPLSAAEALRRLLVAAGADDIPVSTAERAALWRGLLAERRVLVYLDNAASSAQLRPLLPGAGGATVLVSGRRRLGALPVGAAVSLDVLDAEASRRLLGQWAGERRLVDDPVAVHTVLDGCAGLPAAVVLAGLALRHRAELTVAEFAARMADPLTALRVESAGLTEVFAPSVAALSEPAASVLGELAGGTAIADQVVTDQAAVEELLDAGLVTARAGEFLVHPLLGEYVLGLRPGRARRPRRPDPS